MFLIFHKRSTKRAWAWARRGRGGAGRGRGRGRGAVPSHGFVR